MLSTRTSWIAFALPFALVGCAETMDDAGQPELGAVEQASVAAELAPTVEVTLPTSVEVAPIAVSDIATVQVDAPSVTPVEEPVRLVDVAAQEAEVEFGAVGMMVREVEGAIVVDDVMDGMSAQAAGLEPGMHIVAVDGMETEGMGLHQFVSFVRGEEGTSVTLTVVDGDAEPVEMALERQTLVMTETRCDRIRRARNETEFGGIGVRLGGSCGSTHVQGVEAGMPAELAGLQDGDVIVAVDGMQVEGAHLMDVVGVMRGEVGSIVELDLRGADGATRTVEIERVHMVVPEGNGCGQ